MDEGRDQPWSNAEHLPRMDDDFSPFFDLENSGIDLSMLDEGANGGPWSHSDGTQPQNAFSGIDFGSATSYPQQFNNLPHHDSHFQGHFSVPPTPNSSEMYPHHAEYNQHSDAYGQFAFNRYQQQGGNQAFTPMVSPDVPAVGSAYSFVPQYTKPGEYLSPLTSPAINPQVMPRVEGSQTSTAVSSLATSPVLNGSDSVQDPQAANDRPRKTRKKSAVMPTPPSKARQSAPTTKSLRSRTIPAKKNSKEKDTTQNSSGVQPDANASLTLNSSSQDYSTNSAGSESVSPRPQVDAAMAPPPKPGSNAGTPAMTPQRRPTLVFESSGLPPATPASIMRLPKGSKSSNQGQTSPDSQNDVASPTMGNLGNGLEDLRLPEAAAVTRSTKPASSAQLVPQSAPTSVPQTPLTITTPSPATLDGRGKSDIKSTQGQRKRGSMSSATLISPAVRPRISPSIKPLLPEGATPISNEAHALILASKSNYQNILEGNQLINYPSELSTNLTSKRTSHKLAEQGRRNRINVALQEMQSLLPLGANGSKDQENDDTSEPNAPKTENSEPNNGDRTPTTPAATSNSSKAATVEMAIVHIKDMHKKLATKELENEQLRQEMKALQAKLADGSEAPSN